MGLPASTRNSFLVMGRNPVQLVDHVAVRKFKFISGWEVSL